MEEAVCMEISKRPQFTVLSTFTGAMGLDIGIEKTGRFKILACIENDPASCETIRRNRDAGRTSNAEMRVYEADISKMDPFEVMKELGLEPGQLDLLIGGPPCQTFSTAGNRGTLSDVRGMLVWDFLRFVEAFRPKFFLMENVRGLMSAAVRHRKLADRPNRGGPPLSDDELPGSVLRQLMSDMKRAAPEYRVDIFEVNAVNYGAPQIRERVLFIGNRFNHRVEFPEPTHGPKRHESGQASLFDESLPEYRTLGDAIKGLKESDPVIMDFSPRKKRYLSMVPPGGNWRTLPVDVQQESMGATWKAKGGRSGWWRRLSYGLPSPTVVTMPNHASTSMCHPEEIRALTVKECALIQEFPAEWEFVGSPQDQYRQVGNAVPVRLGVVSGDLLIQHLDDLYASDFESQSGDHPHHRVVYLRSHVRTRQWFKDGESITWSDDNPSKAKYSAPKTERRVRMMG